MRTPTAVGPAGTVDRLTAELGARLPRRTIEIAVERALRDLRGSPVPALPELVERLARQRLTDSAISPTTPVR
ncbi:three-helix bundle dimerization domain-containing protein [Nocardia africana]|uniref:Uncharacterized protein n=1 Tax=Nocardia africana TaxID=134964 RepID=A0A378X6L6_9NOCA|nr:hypothetical protein [Nocardia africana]MCC3317624.1 hypothetical protein [Nocardia africana]SUA48384.1 Uncharacterised protein [Nocardia africana]